MKRIGVFWSTLILLAIIFALISYGIPFVSREITGMDFPMPVPGTLMVFYGMLILISAFLYLSSDEERLNDFLQPPVNLLKGSHGEKTRLVVLSILPLIFGWQVYSFAVPKISSPVSLRIQHPSSNFPKKNEAMENPLRNPADAEVDLFIEQVKNNAVEFIPQANMPPGGIDFIPTKPVREFLKGLKEGEVDKAKAKEALIEKYLFEGRILYEMNCRPCHGDSAAGDGPMANGFQLRPINFTDNGTIEVIVEGYTFWRVGTGGPGLPKEATPWDSAMPVWKLDLTEKERWKIILAEYYLAGKMPRVPEKLEHK